MKAADAAGLMAARTGDVVEPALEAADRADVVQASRRLLAAFLSAATMSLSLNTGLGALALHQAERRLQVRGVKTGRRRGDRALGQKLFGDQDRAAIEFENAWDRAATP